MVMNLKWLGIGALALAAATAAPAQTWRQVGPAGGTVISLEADPRDANKLYLGTSDGHVFASTDEGGHWQLLSRIGTGQDDVITHILVDPRDSNRIYATTWALYSGGGGVYRSNDAGRTWNLIGLAHENVRAIAQAPTEKNVFVVGAVSGVYRSTDDGSTWQRITPVKHEDLRNFDSIAFDPRDENIIYAGTYHLPWKTTDGGKNWFNIGKGMIDDSDVMSVIVDPANPDNVHATACSGIYHSTNGAQQWTRYNGIPFVFRRTQLIKQDPQHPDTLYAGTTSGLWKTTNEGGEWKRMTPGDWVINSIILDARNPQRVILGTEREGVQISENGGQTYTTANNGFHHQHILDVAFDRDRPERALVVLTFDTNAFLATKDGGTTWAPLGPGLKRTDLKHVYASPTGWVASLNNGGLMKYDETSGKWLKTGLYALEAGEAPAPVKVTKVVNGKKTTVLVKKPAPKAKAPTALAFQVNDLAFGSEAWYAATTGGLLVSRDHGSTWKSAAGKNELVKQPVQSLEASNNGSQVWAISQRNLLYSADAGKSWEAKELSFAAAGNLNLHRIDDNSLFITTNAGLFATKDAGRNWNRADIRDLQFQAVAGSGNALLVALQRRGLLASLDGGKSYQRVNSAFAEGYVPAVRVRRDGTVVAASATEGLLALDPDARSADTSSGGGMASLAPSSTAQKPRK
jgi:photosystem II stability/assembly factor-like uncharacterized protein